MSDKIIQNFFSSLELMWKGMLGLFVVCGSLVIVMMIVSKICKITKR
jgi:hypothetical protein